MIKKRSLDETVSDIIQRRREKKGVTEQQDGETQPAIGDLSASRSGAKWRQGVRLSFKREGALERESIDVWFTGYSIRKKNQLRGLLAGVSE